MRGVRKRPYAAQSPRPDAHPHGDVRRARLGPPVAHLARPRRFRDHLFECNTKEFSNMNIEITYAGRLHGYTPCFPVFLIREDNDAER